MLFRRSVLNSNLFITRFSLLSTKHKYLEMVDNMRIPLTPITLAQNVRILLSNTFNFPQTNEPQDRPSFRRKSPTRTSTNRTARNSITYITVNLLLRAVLTSPPAFSSRRRVSQLLRRSKNINRSEKCINYWHAPEKIS